MAKTLIGNVKGKDGRGIASIKKTGTTGSVDTYTIKYTDGTTSTYDVNNSDSVSLQRQIVPSAAVESSATASQAYAAGDYVVVNGILRKVKSSIAKGNAISDSNSTATTVTGELATLGKSVPNGKLDIGVKNIAYGQIWAEYYGKIVMVHVVGVGVASAINPFNQMTMGNIPQGYRPSVAVTAAVYSSPSTAIIQVNSDGNLILLARDNTINKGMNVDGTLTYMAR